jgi:hydrogenase/urease accessory protein HupE
MKFAWRPLIALSVAAATAAPPAHAHLVETGFGAFYDGLAHLALTPADLLLVIALALVAGQRGTQAARWVLFALPVAWLAGGAVGVRFPFESTLPVFTTLTFALAGVLVAFDAKLRAISVAAFAIAAGLLHGTVNGATMMPGGANLLGLAGAVTAVFCLLAFLSAHVATLHAGWSRIAVRVAGSWIAAAGVLMLGWLAAGTDPDRAAGLSTPYVQQAPRAAAAPQAGAPPALAAADLSAGGQVRAMPGPTIGTL